MAQTTFKEVDPMIAVPFSDKTPLSTISQAKKSGMNAAELRLDLFSSYKKEPILREIKKFKNILLIATIRSKKEGGSWTGSEKERLELFKAIIPSVDMVDIEFSSKIILKEVIRAAHARRKKVLVSFHDFKKTPSDVFLKKFIAQARKAGADIVKIAVMARSYSDVKRLGLLTANQRQKKIVTISMGKTGAISRVIFPSLGSCITFASWGKKTAPGQMDLKTTALLLKKLR